MTKVKSLGFKIIATAILGLSLIGCGGSGGSSSGDTTPTELATNTGAFVDSPVEGLQYSTTTLSGNTDNQGRFQYKDGETVTFKIGNLELGSAKGGKLMTPLTLTGENDLNNISSKVTNIARILQSLDENSSNSGLIKIPSSLKDLEISNIDLESDADLNTILSEAQTITSKSYVLKDSATAKADMKKYIGLYNQYDIISAGYYSGTGTKYYLLAMPKENNIIFSANWLDWGSGVMHLFDTDLNEINYFDEDNAIEKDKTVKLAVGLYIIKVDYPSDGGLITINSPSLVDQTNFEQIISGTYTGTKMTYYLLTMQKESNIIFSADWLDWGGGVMHLFDTNLNEINYFDNDNAIEKDKTVKLPKGNYIIKVSYPSKGGEITVNYL